jgi:hypothetical protein
LQAETGRAQRTARLLTCQQIVVIFAAVSLMLVGFFGTRAPRQSEGTQTADSPEEAPAAKAT